MRRASPLSRSRSWIVNRNLVSSGVARAEAAAVDAGTAYARFWAASTGGMAAYQASRWTAAVDGFAAARAQLREAGIGHSLPADVVTLFEGFARWYRGELRRAAAVVGPALQRAVRAGNRWRGVSFRSWLVPGLALAADDVDGARRHLDRARGSWVSADQAYLLQHAWCAQNDVQVALYAGSLGAVSSSFAAARRALRRALLGRLAFVAAEYDHAAARVSIARAVEAPAAARADLVAGARRPVRALERRRCPLARPLALLVRAGMAGALGRDDQAVDHLRAAVAALRASETMLHARAAERRLGELLGGDEGGELVTAADAWMIRQGVKRPDRMTAMLVPGWPHPG